MNGKDFSILIPGRKTVTRAQYEISDGELAKHTKRIGELSHEDLGRLWRFAPTGHPYFRSDLPLFDVFQRRFAELGGWTPELSKQIGWTQ